MNTQVPLADKLKVHLDAEYDALLNGDIAKIEAFAEAKASLLHEVSQLPVSDIAQFQALREKLVRNQLLTHSAISGMRSAIERAKEISAVSRNLTTYTAAGTSNSVAVETGRNLSKRS